MFIAYEHIFIGDTKLNRPAASPFFNYKFNTDVDVVKVGVRTKLPSLFAQPLDPRLGAIAIELSAERAVPRVAALRGSGAGEADHEQAGYSDHLAHGVALSLLQPTFE